MNTQIESLARAKKTFKRRRFRSFNSRNNFVACVPTRNHLNLGNYLSLNLYLCRTWLFCIKITLNSYFAQRSNEFLSFRRYFKDWERVSIFTELVDRLISLLWWNFRYSPAWRHFFGLCTSVCSQIRFFFLSFLFFDRRSIFLPRYHWKSYGRRMHRRDQVSVGFISAFSSSVD